MLLVVCKLAKIWFIMQRTLSQINAVSTFFLQEIFFIRSFSAKPRVCFCSTVADSSWCFSLRSFVSSSTCFLNHSCLSDPCFGERELQLLFHFTLTSISEAGRAALTSGLAGYWSRPRHRHLQNCQTRESRRTLGCLFTAFVLFDTCGEPGNGLGDEKRNEPQFFKNVFMVLKEFI